MLSLNYARVFPARTWYRAFSALSRPRSHNTRHRSTDEPRQPLRVLFCGSDQFSISSLAALVDIKKRDESIIESVQVVCRPDKRVGSGLKKINEVPIKKAAREHGLRIHQLDSFREYQSSQFSGINLIVAVSFGLLVPAELINSTKYGGLNVHPSLLPDLRGASPIHYALLNRRSHTGVTVQTLHPTKFDHGQIVAQTLLPGIMIPANSTPSTLLPALAQEGARLLRNVIEDGAYMKPLQSIDLSAQDIALITDDRGIAKAPRFQKSDMRIDWANMKAADISLRHQVFGRLWDDTIYRQLATAEEHMRIIFDDIADASEEAEMLHAIAGQVTEGTPIALEGQPGEVRLFIFAADRSAIEVRSCTIASKKLGHGKAELLRLMMK